MREQLNRLRHQIRNMEVVDRYPIRSFSCKKKFCLTLFFILWGNCYFIIDSSILKHHIISVICCIVLSLVFFFQLILFNLISFILILIFIGFRRFIREFDHLYDIFLNKIIIILLTFLLGTFCLTLKHWKNYISNLNNSTKRIIKVIIYFPCLIMSTIIIFPQKLFINIFGIIFLLIYRRHFSTFLDDLENIYRRAF